MKVSIIGSGYVGLVSGVCLAAKEHDVTCLDTRKEVVDKLNNGEAPIHEEGLPDLLMEVLGAGHFRAEFMEAGKLAGSDIILLAVGTPTTDGMIDLVQIEAASRTIGAFIQSTGDKVCLVVKSTVVPGTTDTFVRQIIEDESGKKIGDFGLGMNPEFLREGDAIIDFMQPDRIVLGHEDGLALERLEELYAPWDCEKIRVNSRTAEMIKYANNCLLATQISATNELANIAAAIGGIDIMDVMQGVHLDGRWSPMLADKRVSPGILSYLIPGCGFGGSCFPKDVQAMRRAGEEAGIQPHLLEAVLEINRTQPSQVVKLLAAGLGDLKDKTILLLGLAFKPGTDDIRESVSLRVIEDLDKFGALVLLHDPIATENCREIFPATERRIYVDEWRASVASADAVVVITKWDEYRALTSDPTVSALLNRMTIVDAHRMFDPTELPGSNYLAIGRSISN